LGKAKKKEGGKQSAASSMCACGPNSPRLAMTNTSSSVQEKRGGILTSFNPLKSCGTITTRTGTTVESFFFHATRLIHSEVEVNEIRIGLWARFRVSEVPPKPGTFPHATHIELYLANPTLVGGMDALAGKTSSTEVSQ